MIGDDLLDFLDKPFHHLNEILLEPGSFSSKVLWLALPLALPRVKSLLRVLSSSLLHLISRVLLLLPEELVVGHPTEETQLRPHRAFGWSSSGNTGKLCPSSPSLPHNPRVLLFPSLLTQGGWGLISCT